MASVPSTLAGTTFWSKLVVFCASWLPNKGVYGLSTLVKDSLGVSSVLPVRLIDSLSFLDSLLEKRDFTGALAPKINFAVSSYGF